MQSGRNARGIVLRQDDRLPLPAASNQAILSAGNSSGGEGSGLRCPSIAAASLATRVPSKKRGFYVSHSSVAFTKVKAAGRSSAMWLLDRLISINHRQCEAAHTS